MCHHTLGCYCVFFFVSMETTSVKTENRDAFVLRFLVVTSLAHKGNETILTRVPAPLQFFFTQNVIDVRPRMTSILHLAFTSGAFSWYNRASGEEEKRENNKSDLTVVVAGKKRGGRRGPTTGQTRTQGKKNANP